jgi:hypothetical protein
VTRTGSARDRVGTRPLARADVCAASRPTSSGPALRAIGKDAGREAEHALGVFRHQARSISVTVGADPTSTGRPAETSVRDNTGGMGK